MLQVYSSLIFVFVSPKGTLVTLTSLANIIFCDAAHVMYDTLSCHIKYITSGSRILTKGCIAGAHFLRRI